MGKLQIYLVCGGSCSAQDLSKEKRFEEDGDSVFGYREFRDNTFSKVFLRCVNVHIRDYMVM